MLRLTASRLATSIAAAVAAATVLTGCQSPVRVIQVSGPTAVPSTPTASQASQGSPTSGQSTAASPSPSEPPAAGPSTSPTSLGTPSPTPGQSAGASIDHVVAISVDGLNPDAITDLGPTGTPTLRRLLREGAGTLNARTAREQTRTLPNHTGMLTGRRVDAAAGGHGYTSNTDQGSTVQREAGRYVPSVFDVVHDRGGSTALFAAKDKFAVYQRTWNRDGAADETGRDDGTAKIDRFVVDTDDERLTGRVTADLGQRPATFTFVHIAAPDEAGHADGFMSAGYLEAVKRTDAMLGRIVAAIQDSATLRDHTVLIMTADHGGRGQGP